MASRAIVFLGLKGGETERAVEDTRHLLLDAREGGIGERHRLLPVWQHEQSTLGRGDRRGESRCVAGGGLRPPRIGAIGQRAHIVGIDLQQARRDDIGLGRLIGGLPGRDRLFEGFGPEHAARIPRDKDFHRRRALGGVARIERGHIGVVLGRDLESVPRLGGDVGCDESKGQRQNETKPTYHRHRNLPSPGNTVTVLSN